MAAKGSLGSALYAILERLKTQVDKQKSPKQAFNALKYSGVMGAEAWLPQRKFLASRAL